MLSLPMDVIVGESARDAFMKAIEHCGLEKVISAGFHYSGEPLVSKTQHKMYSGQSKKVNGGYFIQTHSNTQSKVKTLEKLFSVLGIKVDIISNDGGAYM